MDEITVNIRNLSKQYGNFKAVDNISFAAGLGRSFVLNTPADFLFLLYLVIFCFLFLGVGAFLSRKWLKAE
jgi:hypothetical protein